MSEQSTELDFFAQMVALTSYGGLAILFVFFLVICTFGVISFIRIMRTQRQELEFIAAAQVKREHKFLYEKIRQQLEKKISEIVALEESQGGEYSGADLIERINLELDKEELAARALPVGDDETIIRLKIIGEWRMQLQNGLLKAIAVTES